MRVFFLPGTLARPLAAAHDRELPAHVCRHFVQLGRLHSPATRRGRAGQRRQAAPTNGRPTPHMLPLAWPPERPTHAARRAAGAKWPPLRRTGPNLHTDDHQTVAASAHELGVGLAAFASGGAIHSPTGMHVSSGLGVARPRHGADIPLASVCSGYMCT